MKFFLLSCLCATVILMCQAQPLHPLMYHNRRLNLRSLDNNLEMPDNLYLNNRRTFPLFGGLGGMLGGGIGGGISAGLSGGIGAGIGGGIGGSAYGYGGLGGGLYGGYPYYG